MLKFHWLGVRRAENSEWEEEVARERPSACALENGRTRGSVKANERGYHLISRKWKCGIWQDAREGFAGVTENFLRADGFGKGKPPAVCRTTGRDALIVDAVSGAN